MANGARTRRRYMGSIDVEARLASMCIFALPVERSVPLHDRYTSFVKYGASRFESGYADPKGMLSYQWSRMAGEMGRTVALLSGNGQPEASNVEVGVWVNTPRSTVPCYPVASAGGLGLLWDRTVGSSLLFCTTTPNLEGRRSSPCMLTEENDKQYNNVHSDHLLGKCCP